MKKPEVIKIVLLLGFAFICALCTNAQEAFQLENILKEVVQNSFAANNAKNEKDLAYEGFNFYKSQLRPSLSLTADLPNYNKTSSPTIQPDGSIAFQAIRQANSRVSLFATQVIQATGGTVFVNSDLQRFDDFTSSFEQYNGIPLRVGINQPLFGFNPWKHQKEIQNLLIHEAEKNYNLNIEQSLTQAANLYFNILIARQNLEIARTNEQVNERLLKITDERFKLGKVSKDEKLQLEIELNNAKLNVSQATSELDRSIASLFTYLSKPIPKSDSIFEVPATSNMTDFDVSRLLDCYKKNRPEIIAYHRAKAEAKQDLSKAKADFGLQADLQASIGLARGADQLSEVYTDPFDQQQFNVSINVPILDWGKRKSALKQIELQEDNLDLAYQQNLLELENTITQNAILFSRLQNEIKLLQEIMEKAEQRFSISNERYVLGNIDITNLTLAQREKDQTKRNYINALKSYWTTYYSLRALSGYDILNNQEIIYK